MEGMICDCVATLTRNLNLPQPPSNPKESRPERPTCDNTTSFTVSAVECTCVSENETPYSSACDITNCEQVKSKDIKSKTADVSNCKCSFQCPFQQKMPTKQFNADNTSLFSTDSSDLDYIDKIKQLAQKERCLKQEIQELEHKEKTYTDKLKEVNNARGQTNTKDNSSQNVNYQNQQLKDDNKYLEDEIQDVKLQLKQVRENVEGPLKRELEREKRKCEQLENQLRNSKSKESSADNKNRQEVEFMSKQLENCKRNLKELNLINKRLREEVCVLSCKCNEMQNELINQKLGEINLLSKLSAKKKKQPSPCICQNQRNIDAVSLDDTTQGNDLDTIARNLSALLVEAKQCNECRTGNTDLIDTVNCIKNLVDVVKDTDGNKGSDRNLCTCSNTNNAK